MTRFISLVNFVHLTSAAIVIAAVYVGFLQDKSERESSVKDPLIFISVISAPENYEYRRTIRETWGKWTKTHDADLKFVIGKECWVPPDDREFDQGCTEISWLHGTSFNNTFWSDTFTTEAPPQRTQNGFAFIVNFPIVLNSVKLARWGQTGGQTMVTVTNAHTQEQLDSLQFSSFRQNEAELKTKPYLLPRGFEGIVYVEGDFEATNISCHTWTDHGNFIKPTWLVGKDLTLPVNSNACVPVAFSFQFSGVDKFVQERQERLRQWREHLSIVSKNLNEENDALKDILFVETIDVYRNLTSKMLDVFQWLESHRRNSFLLKVDDDTFVDFKKMEKYIKSVASEVGDDVWWWADLKRNWLVSRYGKWRDNVYLSLSYPPFPCGAAYVISPYFAALLGKNASFLLKYPFEDTALGLWSHSANLSPTLGRTDECDMSCGTRQTDCKIATCFILQCNSGDMRRFMSNHEQKGFVC